MTAMVLGGPSASATAATGFNLDSGSSIPIVSPRIVASLAIDQVTERLYLAVGTLDISSGIPGELQQLESNGSPAPTSPITTGLSNTYFSGAAVDPTTQNLYINQIRLKVPAGTFGEHRMRVYTPAGVQIATWPLSNTITYGGFLATDSNGLVFYTNDETNLVEAFNSSGVPQPQFTINCGTCPGGPFVSPAGIAIDSDDNAYVLDRGTDKVIKFTRSGESYVYASVLQSGRLARALAVDPTTNDVFVGSNGALSGSGYHVIAYNSAGAQIDDFGAGFFAPVPPQFSVWGSPQIAVNTNNDKVFIGDSANYRILDFDRGTIPLPTTSTDAASAVGQITATMNATVNPNGHALLECEFEYTDEADFQANGFDDAESASCPSLLDGTTAKAVKGDLSGLTASTTYRYRVVATSNAGTASGGAGTFTTLAVVSPTTTSDPAVKILQAGATLAGRINPHGGVSSDCHFEYGTTVAYGKQIPCSALPTPATTDVAQQRTVSSLTPNTTYHFRLVGTTNAGTDSGDDREFKTLPFLPPTVVSNPAATVTGTGATVSGSINPNGAGTSCNFEFGTSTSYGLIAPCPADPGTGTSPVAQELFFGDLTPGTTYHYRLVGTGPAGTGQGGDVSFTTSAPPVVPPPLPPPPTTPPVVKKPPLTCKKGFQKKKVKGKLRCVKKKKKKAKKRK